MCFYDQSIFTCGDFKWGNVREHCDKEYRTGETCGMKLVMQTFAVSGKCRVCLKIETKQRRIEAEIDRIRRWKREGSKFEVSVLRSEEMIQQLKQELQALIRDRKPTRGQLGLSNDKTSNLDSETEDDDLGSTTSRLYTSQEYESGIYNRTLRRAGLRQDAHLSPKKERRKRPAERRSNVSHQLESSSSLPNPNLIAADKSVRGKTKRRLYNRSPPPPGNEGGDMSDEGRPRRKHCGLKRLFACPYYKHDKQKYSISTETGVLYRSCSGPGFRKVSDVK